VTAQRVDQHMAGRAAAMLPQRITPELRTRYRQLPMMVRTSGLAGAYAFLIAKSDQQTDLGRAYAKLASGIRSHLTERALISDPNPTNHAVLAALAAMAPQAYARAAAETELLAGWLSRLAEAKHQADKADSATAPQGGEPGQ
jgi:CRISPR type III-B/RAMP module-associated protein Cmr5